MRILLSGATGFLGRKLSKRLLIEGHELVILTRNAARTSASFPLPAKFYDWNPLKEQPPAEAFDGVGAAVHLAGDPVAEGRWTPDKKAAIRNSRVLGTRHLMARIDSLGKSAPKVVVSASAIGFYGDRGDEWVNESSPVGDGFLADVCREWETEVFSSGSKDTRRVAIRVGIVLGRDGGALAKLLPVFRAGLGGPLGSGTQWMSWIHVDDLVSLIDWAIFKDKAQGAINGVAPQPVTQADFSRELARSVSRPSLIPTPAAALRLALGEMSSVVLTGQRVACDKAQKLGFQWIYPALPEALESFSPRDEEMTAEQWIPQPIEPLWDFFSAARNLEEITPPWLGFQVVGMSSPEIGDQTLIDYKLKIHGFPIRWQSRIQNWNPPRSFVDTQVLGPYAKWHHTHSFHPMAGGTLIEDRVLYRVPMGVLGKVFAGGKVRRDVEMIFEYRKKIIAEKFGK